MTLHVHHNIAGLTPYSPGKPLEELERELGITNAVKLASNENPRGTSPLALAALSQGLASLHRYPDGGAHRLREALGEHWKVAPERIVVGNGSDELISLLIHTFLAPGEEAVMADHTFVIYHMAVTGAHGRPIQVPLRDWKHDLDAMADAVSERTRLLFICNPNNPTGTIVSADEVASLMARVPDHVVVVFDEAYFEYVQASEFPDTLRLVQENRNVVVLRTFSKIYGLAGLRIGYGMTTPEIAGYLHRLRPPFNANAVAQYAAIAALRDERHVAESRAMNRTEMAAMQAGLTALGLQPVSSEANFLYVDTKRDGREVFERLLKQGVIVRHIEGSRLRVTIGLPAENRRFLDVLAQVLPNVPVMEGRRSL